MTDGLNLGWVVSATKDDIDRLEKKIDLFEKHINALTDFIEQEVKVIGYSLPPEMQQHLYSLWNSLVDTRNEINNDYTRGEQE